MFKLYGSIASAVLLAGCISAPKNYVAPKHYAAPASDTAPALLRSAFPTRMGRHDSMALYVVERATCDASKIGAQPVFYIGEHTRPGELDVKPVAMAADQPILMQYYATLSAGRFCKIFVKAQFEPGKHYAAYGGSDIHILSFKQDTCSFTIVDEETKIPLPMEQVPLSCPR